MVQPCMPLRCYVTSYLVVNVALILPTAVWSPFQRDCRHYWKLLHPPKQTVWEVEVFVLIIYCLNESFGSIGCYGYGIVLPVNKPVINHNHDP